MHRTVRSSRARSRGFTILELIVAIGIVTILLSLVIPSLRQSREQTKSVARLANLRSLASIVETYADSWDDTYPMADTKPGYFGGTEPTPDGFVYGRVWYEAIIDAGLMTRASLESAEQLHVRNVLYSRTLMHENSYFHVDGLRDGADRVVSPVRRSQVLYPSSKGSMVLHSVDGSGEMPDSSWCCVYENIGPVTFLDGSAELLHRGQLQQPRIAPIGDIGLEIISTWDGVQGVDR